MVRIPQAFAENIVRLAGDAARAWLDGLPRVVQEHLGRWSLVPDGEPRHGGLGLVVPVRRGVEPCVLKVSWPDGTTRHEAAALRAWDGDGAVRLLAEAADVAQVKVLLLERLDAGRSLNTLPLDEALEIVGRLPARLAVPAPPGIPTLWRWALDFVGTARRRAAALGMPPRPVDVAVDIAARLGPSARGVLVHTDLHYENVLAGRREPWLAIDPKVVAGDPEFAVAPLLWRRVPVAEDADPEEPATYTTAVDDEVVPRRLDRLVEAGGLDAERAYGWALVRCVDYEIWCRSVGLTMDPACCAALTRALVSWMGGHVDRWS